MVMGNKPKEEWHKYKVLKRTVVEKVNASISLNKVATRRLYEDLKTRVERGTGVRFSLEGKGAIKEISRGEDEPKQVSVELYDEKPFIYPESSPHTNRYDSTWNRIEIYIPYGVWEDSGAKQLSLL